MIQAPNLQNVPVQAVQAGNQQEGASTPVQTSNQSQQQPVIYNYPTTSSYETNKESKSRAQYNGVYIEITDPQGQSGYGAPGQAGSVSTVQNDGQFNGVSLSIKNPKGQGLSNTYPIPAQYYLPNQPIANTPIYYPPQAQNKSTNEQPVQPAQVQPLPQPVNQQPLPPAPIVEQAPVSQVNAIETQPVQKPVVAPPVVVQHEPLVSNVNPETFAGRLKSNDLDSVRSTIEEIAEKVKNSETDGTILLDTQIFDALVDVINKDTSSLAGPTPEAIELRKKNPDTVTAEEIELMAPTQLEKAEINKQYALYTLSFMQERLNDELLKRNGSALELKDLPCIETVIENVKTNQNPTLRVSAIAALSHIERPEYKDDLKTIFELAKSDEDANVREAAIKAEENLGAIPNIVKTPNLQSPVLNNQHQAEQNVAA